MEQLLFLFFAACTTYEIVVNGWNKSSSYKQKLFFFLSLPQTTSVGFVMMSRSLKWMTWKCLCWLSTEKNRNLTKFCSRSTAASQIWLCCRTFLAEQSPLSSESQLQVTRQRNAGGLYGASCCSQLCFQRLQSRCVTTRNVLLSAIYKRLPPGDDPSWLWSCCPLLPCTKQAASHEAFLHELKERKKEKRKPKGKCYRRHTGGTSVPQSDKIKAFFCTFPPVWKEFASKTQKGYCCTAVFYYRKGRSNILKPIYNMLDVSCAMKKMRHSGLLHIVPSPKIP